MEKITVAAAKGNLPFVSETLRDKIYSNIADENILFAIDICVEEVFVNICEYAYTDKAGNVEIEFDIIKKDLFDYIKITFIDSGTPYNPLERADPDITLPAEERPMGGLGVFMVKNMMDFVYYEYTDNKNKFTMEKKLN